MDRLLNGGFSFRSAVSRCLLLLVVCLALTSIAGAQSTALLNGTVTDATGAAVPNAKVVVKNTATNVEWTTQTDSAGIYLFSSLPIGFYRIEVSAPSFRTTVINGLQLQVAMVVTKDIQLQLGQIAQQVVITAESAIVETATSAVSTVLSDKTVQEIPLNGRHFVDLGLLTAGTMTPPANGFLTSPLRGQGSFAIDTAGNREDTTNWLVNGINLNDAVQNQVTFQPPIDTLAEIKIDNNSFAAQYGRNSGSIVNLATRSGSNEFHGEAFDFLRNNALDARNFFNPTEVQGAGGLVPNPQGPFIRNDFGADFGGPVIKNKLFFFLAYEGLRQHQGLTLTTFVPSEAQIATVTSPAVTQLLKLVPAANEPGTDKTGIPANFNGFTGAALANVSLNQGSADLDFEWTASDRIHGYYVVQKDLREEPTQGANLPGFGDTRSGFRQLMTISEDHIFSPSITNTARLGFNRIHLFFTPTALNPADFDITLPAGAPVGVGIPNILVSGAMDFGGPQAEPQGRGDTTVVGNDTLSWLKGRHAFAFGGEIRRAYNNNVAENVGSFSFTSLANFVADKSAAFTVELGAGNDRIVEPSYGIFAQDSFKWKSNFTFNFGLRYEWNSTPSEALNRFTNFDLGTGTLVPAPQPFHTNNENFEPRIGFAWDPFRDGKTSVRAAYAIMTQDPTTNVITGLSGNPPFAVPISVNSGTSAITLENPAAAIVGVGLGPAVINPEFDNAYAQDWNLTIERQLSSTMGLEVAYVGMKGTHLQIIRNVNQPLLTDGFYDTVRPFPTLPLSSAVLPAQCAPPNPPCTLGTMSEIDSPGNSNYNALWVNFNKHLSNGLEFLASYTYSKSLDYSSVSSGDAVPLQNAYNPRGDYGLSEFDARHRFVLSGFYNLPFRGNRLVSGWEVGAITQLQSGNPVTPLVQVNLGPAVFNLRPDAVGPVHGTGKQPQFYSSRALCENYNGTPTAPTIPDCASDPSAVFAMPCTFDATSQKLVPGSCHPGDINRDGLPGPDFVNTDFSIIKNTKLTERFNLQFRAEMFDVFNHPNFGDPGNVLASASSNAITSTIGSFGVITSTRFPTGDFGSSRQVAFALKLLF